MYFMSHLLPKKKKKIECKNKNWLRKNNFATNWSELLLINKKYSIKKNVPSLQKKPNNFNLSNMTNTTNSSAIFNVEVL